MEELANEVKKGVTNLMNDGTFVKSAVPLLKEEITPEIENWKNEIIAAGKQVKQELKAEYAKEIEAGRKAIVKGVKTTVSATKKLVKQFGEQKATDILVAAKEGLPSLKKLATNFEPGKKANITERGLLFLLMLFLAIGGIIGGVIGYLFAGL